MFQNLLKSAWRNILRYKAYTIVNILSLSLGICACMVIYVIVHYEFSFDSFHPGKDRIYRVGTDIIESTGDRLHFARSPLAVALNGRDLLPGFEAIGAVVPYNAKIEVPQADKQTKQFASRNRDSPFVTTVIAEPQYFSIFSYEWLAGNVSSLNAPFKVVLTKSRVNEYFGAIEPAQAMGRQIIYGDSLRVSVAGVIKDWENNSDLLFTDFISYATTQNSFLQKNFVPAAWTQRDLSAWVFARLSKQASPSQVNTGLQQLIRLHADPKAGIALRLEPLSSIHFNADIVENPIRTAHKPTLHGLMVVALFVLILAIINFINLSTSQSVYRIREIGIRKVLGSTRSALVVQFLLETFSLAFVAMLVAISIVQPVLNAFHDFIPEGITFKLLSGNSDLLVVPGLLGISIIGGLYPAWILSSNKPTAILKGLSYHKGSERGLTRKVLTVFQFSVSLVFIISSIIIGSQLRYMREKDLGFVADAIITVETPRGDSMSKISVFTEKLKRLSGVQEVALQWISPMTDNARGMKLKFKNSDLKDFWVTQVAGDENFIPLYNMKLLAGRNLEKTDSVREFVINETLAKMMGSKDPKASLGQFLYWNERPYPVIGVVADFHTSSLHEPVTPLCIINRPERQGSVAIKLTSKGKDGSMVKTVITQIERSWKEIYPASTFSFRFYDESLAMLYKKDQQTLTLVNTSMFLAIFISCIGLFGLALFTAGKRAKEISIRKILGAGISDILILLSKDFVVLVIIALLVASPVAWYFINHWLDGFSYRIQIGWWIFVLAGAGLLVITLLTVSFHSLKAAVANPLAKLKQE